MLGVCIESGTAEGSSNTTSTVLDLLSILLSFQDFEFRVLAASTSLRSSLASGTNLWNHQSGTMSNPGQISPLRPLTRHITTHNEEGKAVLHSSTPGEWKSYDENDMAFDVIYTTSQFPADLNQDLDLATHQTVVNSGQLGLVNPKGTVCRIVDFAPDNRCVVHRTQSLDYGIVLEGQVEMVLEDGDPVLMQRGDVAVQRATMHGWRNPSATEWARMVFVLQDCKPLTVGGAALKEDLGIAEGILEPSRNDQ
ncbi:Cupin 2 conserved barrel [Penicillium macrosclerotiorum]|uniref:Cupin 2 conserved barrel n=1 Tax=Penicillium macrosclerotiorum TaxID=303699 RepID=UPI002548D84E|nr:Cupin 2 conserved barrel [Penicillium macrosclerotiorum]KAJ5688534.1 Cupin 2 conserved barrel [Penicillium macrosclerotiorum]